MFQLHPLDPPQCLSPNPIPTKCVVQDSGLVLFPGPPWTCSASVPLSTSAAGPSLSAGAHHSLSRLSAPCDPAPPLDCSEDVEEERKGLCAGMAYFSSTGTGGPVQPLRSVREAPTQTGECSGCTRPPDQGNLFSNPHEKGRSQEALISTQAQNLSRGKKLSCMCPGT